MMLRNRSRAVTSKQALMTDSNFVFNQNHKINTSPRFFHGFFARNYYSDAENMSPTSILESKHQFSNMFNPFGYDKSLLTKNPVISSENKQNCYNKLDSQGVGLAIVDEKNTKRMVLFGAKLKVQVPNPLPAESAFSASDQSPKSPADFGIKTRNLHILSPFCSENFGKQSKISSGKLSLSEMEQSEDYTCVITHGPNPKKVHIFDNCIVDNCCGVVASSELKKGRFAIDDSSSKSWGFLSFCNRCKKNLQEGEDIYMYRGEKAFCSNECRNQEMLSEGEDKSELDL